MVADHELDVLDKLLLSGVFFCAGLILWLGWRAPFTSPPASVITSHNFTTYDRDLMIRTIWGEAAHEPRLGQIGVAFVIKNRLQNPYGWKTIAQVVTACGYAKKKKGRVKVCQFEPWVHEKVIARMKAIKTSSVTYREIGAVVDDVMSGRVEDPTGKGWYFLNEKTVAQRVKKGMTLPAFARNGRCKIVIGRHSFCPRIGAVKTAQK